jgi:site-specific recombinase XerD
VSFLAEQGSSGSTIRRRVASLSSLWKWLMIHEHATSNPCAAVVLPKKRQYLPMVLTLGEARRLLVAAEANTNPLLAFRDRAIFATLLFCGLRRSELLDLKLTDLDLKGRWLKVRRGKGMKGRSVPLVPDAVEALSDWLEFRPEVEHDFIFTGRSGCAFGKNGLVRLWERVAKRAGVLREGVS